MMRGGYLPISIPLGGIGKKERGTSRSRLFLKSERWIHVVPLLVFFCFFILWLASHPVIVKVKDGRIVSIQDVDKPLPLNNSTFEIAMLASAASPIAPFPMNLTGNGTEIASLSNSN